MTLGALPVGLAQGVSLRNAVAKGEMVRWSDVTIHETRESVEVRREMERQLQRGSDEFAGSSARQGN
jgi:predicted homoserine dehydrogenase-like protein